MITASNAVQYAFEGGNLVGTPEASVFTKALVTGLESGEADRNDDGKVTINELFEYLADKVREASPGQTPTKWAFNEVGDWEIATSRRPSINLLPADLRQRMTSTDTVQRLSAVAELAGLLEAPDQRIADSAALAFGSLVTDDSERVKTAAKQLLRDRPTNPAPGRPEPRDGEDESARLAEERAKAAAVLSGRSGSGRSGSGRSGSGRSGSGRSGSGRSASGGAGAAGARAAGAGAAGARAAGARAAGAGAAGAGAAGAGAAGARRGRQSGRCCGSGREETPKTDDRDRRGGRRHRAARGHRVGRLRWPQLRTEPDAECRRSRVPGVSGGSVVGEPRGTIVFAVKAGDGYDLWVVSADGSGMKPLVQEAGTQNDPSWSPDHEQIVYRDTRVGLKIVTKGGDPVMNFTNEAKDTHPAWSPNGDTIAFASDRSTTYDVYKLPTSTPNANPIPLADSGAKEWDPSWSPNGDRIAFASGKDGPPGKDGPFAIYTMDMNGDDVKAVTTDEASYEDPAWSPNGDWIAVTRRDPGAQLTDPKQLWLTHPDGTGAHQLMTESVGVSDPTWSADSQFLAYAGGSPPRIVIINIEGKKLRTLGPDGTTSGWPDWR